MLLFFSFLFFSREVYGRGANDSPESATSSPLRRVICTTPTPGSYASAGDDGHAGQRRQVAGVSVVARGQRSAGLEVLRSTTSMVSLPTAATNKRPLFTSIHMWSIRPLIQEVGRRPPAAPTVPVTARTRRRNIRAPTVNESAPPSYSTRQGERSLHLPRASLAQAVSLSV